MYHGAEGRGRKLKCRQYPDIANVLTYVSDVPTSPHPMYHGAEGRGRKLKYPDLANVLTYVSDVPTSPHPMYHGAEGKGRKLKCSQYANVLTYVFGELDVLEGGGGLESHPRLISGTLYHCSDSATTGTLNSTEDQKGHHRLPLYKTSDFHLPTSDFHTNCTCPTNCACSAVCLVAGY